MIETERLILRRWLESDAEDLYRCASNPNVGPIAGWPPHQSLEESLDVIRNVLSGPEAYAVCLKSDGKAIGAIELKLHGHADLTAGEDECELGLWLGEPFWGQGIMPEAAKALIHRAFETLGMQKIWYGYYDGNQKSKRLQEKLGFVHQWTTELDVPLMREKRKGHANLMTRDRYLWTKLYDAARAVWRERRISDYVTCGEVAAAILSNTGRIYTGVCIDTACTLGICAERNAIFNMITHGEHQIEKVLAILPDGSSGAPCGACRELIAQLMPNSYRQVEIMLDYPQNRVLTLGELTPEWWI